MTKKPHTRTSQILCIEYWIHRGFSEDEGRAKISERQSVASKKQKGRVVGDEQRKKMSAIAKTQHTFEYYVAKYGDDALIEWEKTKKRLQAQGVKSSQTRKAAKANFRESTTRCKEYWIKRGYTEYDAVMMVSKTQTRDLPYFQNKYGTEEGLVRWEKKIADWRKSFDDNNDKDEVNYKRSLNGHVGTYSKDNVANLEFLNFYVFIFVDEDGTLVIKYGLTKQPHLSKRWSPNLIHTTMFFERMKSEHAIELEEEFHKLYRRSYKPTKIWTTECTEYTDDKVKIIDEMVRKYLKEQQYEKV